MAVKIKLKRVGQDAQPAVPHRRRRRPHQAGRSRDRGDRQVPPQGGPLAHRGRLRAGAVLARRRRAADRAGRGHPARSPATGRSSRACRAPRAPCASPSPRPTRRRCSRPPPRRASTSAKGPATTPRKKAAKAAEAPAAEARRGSAAEVATRSSRRGRRDRRRLPRPTARRGRRGEPRPPAARGRRGRRRGAGSRDAAEVAEAEAVEAAEAVETDARGRPRATRRPDARGGSRAPRQGHRRAPGRGPGPRPRAAARSGPRGPGAPRRHGQGHRPCRPYGQGAAHRARRARARAAACASTSSTSTSVPLSRCRWSSAGSAAPTAPRRCRVEVRTDEPERRLALGAVLLTDPASRGPLTVANGRVHSGRLLLRFASVEDRTAAEALRGTVLLVEVDPAELPEDDDEWYDHQLVGLAAVALDGTPLGTVTEVVHLPAQDLLAVRTADEREVLVPVRRRDRPRGRRRRRTRRHRPAAAGCSRTSTSSPTSTPWTPRAERGRPARRRRHDLPRLPRAARALAHRQGADSAACSTSRVHDLREHSPPTGTARSTTRPTAAAPAWSCAPSRGARRSTRIRRESDAGPGARRPDAGRASRSPRRWPRSWPLEPHLVFACGRYEGIDARVAQDAAPGYRVRELEPRRLRARRRRGRRPRRRGGGRPAAARCPRQRGVPRRGEPRRRPARGPVYTKPPSWRGLDVPAVLLSGDHGRIAAGGAPRRCGERRPGGPTCWRRSTRPAWTPPTAPLLAELGWAAGDGRIRASGASCGRLNDRPTTSLEDRMPSADRAPATGGACGGSAAATDPHEL